MALGLKLLSVVRLSSIAAIRFILKNYYFVILLFFLLPTVIGSVKLAVEEQNPFLPFIQVGIALADADAQIFRDVQLLKENPEELIGAVKPDKGVWLSIVYYAKFFWNVIIKELGLIWAIAFPFVVLFRFFRMKGSKGVESSVSQNLVSALFYGLLFIFFMNLILIVTGFLDGTIIASFSEDATRLERTGLIIFQALPFHGVASLIYLIISSL